MRVFAALVLGASLFASGAQAEKPTAETKQVTILGRDWLVWPSQVVAGEVVARRQNLELLPERAPSLLTVRQAMRAYRGATGCTANYDTMYRTDNGDYHAALICPK
ncbi:hypothetical protein GG681_06185 [Epibacterium sp. SM1969]|uniref:Uncharacterized protein n=1 Tax=Tritonibacter aquimaris TaxID=2663379 RepID=A0A844ANW7_9RHOB|nr:hypothetical protein [Tritonibacter aquimaris]MQY42223.1 hypothetical protein [Tritonibacter aquimaris]